MLMFLLLEGVKTQLYALLKVWKCIQYLQALQNRIEAKVSISFCNERGKNLF